MMLAGQDQAAHPGADTSADPLIRIQLRRIEQRRVFLSRAPFHIRERIDGKMKEGVELHLLYG